jgi:hypothetical protein
VQRGSGGAPAGRLVVAHSERKAQRALARFAGATLCPVQIVANAAALEGAIDASSVVVVDVALARAHPELRAKPARAWIAVCGDGTTPADPDAVAALLAAGWDHVIANPMPLLAEELLVTAQKLLRADPFGLDKYMVWGAEIRSYQLDDARERAAVVAMLARDLGAVAIPERISSLVSVIADELLANALYAAPVDSHGARTRIAEPRDTPRPLVGREVVTLRWATDARYLAIEVRDRWGSFDPGPLGARLAAARSQTGEGIGLPLAYACANQLVVNVAPGQLTEVIALLDVRYKPTELARCASFHTFTAASAPC